MKITLILVFIAFVLNAFGQGEGLSLEGHSSGILSSHATYQKLQIKDVRIPGNFDFDNFRFADRHQLHLGLDPVQLMDSVYTWRWDSLSNGWVTDFKAIGITYDDNNNLLGYTDLIWDKNANKWKNEEQFFFSYDAHNNLASYLYQKWNGSIWENVQYNTYTYDLDNNQITIKQQNWNGIDWGNISLFITTYDINNNLIKNLRQSWNGTVFENSDQSIFTYDDNNNQTTELVQAWNGVVWENYYLSSKYYDAHHNQINSIVQNWNGNAWVNSSQRISYYDENSSLTGENFQYWNGIDWVEYGQNIYTYDDNNNLIKVLTQTRDTNEWTDSNQELYSYDENNNQISMLLYFWKGGAWVLFFQYSVTYDANNFQLSRVHKRFNADGTMVPIADSTYYYFHTGIVSVDHLALDRDSLSIYPNPSHGKFSINSNHFDKIEIFNLLGERVFTFNQGTRQAKIEINLTHYSSGVYCVLIYDGQQVNTRKIVIQ